MDTLPSQSVLIAGCGDLGTEAGLIFNQLGYRVIGARRRAEFLPTRFERQSIDLRTSAPSIPEDVAVVVLPLTAPSRNADAYRDIYVGGTRNVLDAVAESGQSPRIVFVSSTSVYAIDDGSWVDETTAAEGASPTAALLREAEALVAASEFDSCILRLGGIYGPGRERLIDQVKGGARLPSQSFFTNRIHRDDAARAIVHLATNEDPMPPIVIGVDDEPADLGEVLHFLADTLGLPHPLAGGRPPAEVGNRRLSNALLRSTGFRLLYPTYREGYTAVLEGRQIRHP